MSAIPDSRLYRRCGTAESFPCLVLTCYLAFVLCDIGVRIRFISTGRVRTVHPELTLYARCLSHGFFVFFVAEFKAYELSMGSKAFVSHPSTVPEIASFYDTGVGVPVCRSPLHILVPEVYTIGGTTVNRVLYLTIVVHGESLIMYLSLEFGHLCGVIREFRRSVCLFSTKSPALFLAQFHIIF